MYGHAQSQKTLNMNSSSQSKAHQGTAKHSTNQNFRQNTASFESRSGYLKDREICMNIHRDTESSNVSTYQNNSLQTSISMYFKGTKTSATTSPSELVPSTSKRLHEKYDNFYSQPVNIPEKIPFPRFISKRENEQRMEYTRQLMASESNNIEPPKKIRKGLQTMNVNDDNCGNKLISINKKIESKMFHLIGYVENALNWYELLKNTDIHVVYNVIGKFINVIRGTDDLEKHVFIRGNNGCILECYYYEVEATLPAVVKGQSVACLGHVTGAQKFNLYTMYALDQTTNLDIQRAIFLSQRMVLESSCNKSFEF